jgi:hypothetical protein
MKMNSVKLLSDAMTLYGLSPEQAAGYVGCSGSQIRRWLARRYIPTPIYAQAIMHGIEKMRAELAESDGAWRRPQDVDPEAEEVFNAQMKQLFEELEPHLTPEEKYTNFVANPDYWKGFIAYLYLIRKYKIEIPTWSAQTRA